MWCVSLWFHCTKPCMTWRVVPVPITTFLCFFTKRSFSKCWVFQDFFPTRSLEWWSLLGCCWASCSRSPWERQGRRGRSISIQICLVYLNMSGIIWTHSFTSIKYQQDIYIYIYINMHIYIYISIYMYMYIIYIYISMSNTFQQADLSIPMSSADGLRIGWPHSQPGPGSGEVGLSAHHHLRSSVTEEFRRWRSHQKSENQ